VDMHGLHSTESSNVRVSKDGQQLWAVMVDSEKSTEQASSELCGDLGV